MTSTDLERRGAFLLVAAVASAGAGLVHGAAAGSHAGDTTMTLLFALAAAAQLVWAAVAVLRPAPAILASGAALNGAMVLAWAMARTVGWPVVESMSASSPVGVQDLVAALLAAVAVAGALVAWLGLPAPGWLRTAPVSAAAAAVVLVLAVPAMAAGPTHTHAHDDVHDEGHEHDPAHGHAHGDDAHGDDAHDEDAHDDGHAHTAAGAYDHGDPVITLDDPRLTEHQRAAAQALIDDVYREMARFSDPASVEAEGYVSIGDGITGFEHFSHPVLRMDPITLDPRRPESIVFRVNPDGTKDLVSAMFILPPGQTMDDVPDIAGTLTTWHDHQDLCWIGDRVVGRTGADGACPFGEFRVGQPMMHVWLEPHPCGPFAGLEGHGGSCVQHGH